MKIIALNLLLILSVNLIAQQVQKPICGEIVHIKNFPSKLVEPRNIDIWLPDNYNKESKYSVLYMHDGQNLFDSTTTWNKRSWDVDDIACKLMKSKKINNLIVVGIWSEGVNRHQNYFPQKSFESLSMMEKDTIINQLKNSVMSKDFIRPNSDNYLKYIVTELKPFIDQQYSVFTDAGHTFMAGSSMGGLISIYAICEYPEVFGGVACLITHWLGTFNVDNPFPDSFCKYLKTNLPNPKNHKIYFDHGDQTLDAQYPPFQKKVDEIMTIKGYTQENWESLSFKNMDHSEKSWKERFEIPLLFLFGK
jgi:hypothetical protein